MSSHRSESPGRLLDAALREFAAHGYGGARTELIARAAGVNKQLIFYYYHSKSGLYRAVLERARGSLFRPQAAAAAPSVQHATQRLRDRIRRIAELLSASNHLIARMLVHAAIDDIPGSQPGRNAISELSAEVAQEVSRGQGLGYFRDDVEPKRAAEQTIIEILGALIFRGVFGGSTSEPEPAGWADEVSDRLVRSLTW